MGKSISESQNKFESSRAAQAPSEGSHSPPEIVDFEVLKIIGEGTFGTVWLGKERVTGVYRAIKSFPKTSESTELAGISEYQRRALRHDNLLQVLVIGQSGNNYYVVMELADDMKGSVALDPTYYEPKSLDRVIRDCGSLSPQEALTNLRGILEGLSYLHRQGLVHRDIKPSNVLFVNGKVTLSDFGLVAPGHQAVDRAGTPGYWRPDGPTDRDSDLYAATKIGLQMFTGVENSVASEIPSDLVRVTSPETFRSIQNMLEKGCASNPARRYGSAQAMLSDVHKILNDNGHADSTQTTDKNTVITRGTTSRAFGVVSSLIVLAILCMFGWMYYRQPATAFEPLANMSVMTFPDALGNPNPLMSHDPENLLTDHRHLIKTSSPKSPPTPARFARVEVTSTPGCYMLIFWISPEGHVFMRSTEVRRKSIQDPWPLAYKSMDGDNGGNYVICAILNDRPFKKKEVIRERIEAMVREYEWRTLPQGVIRSYNGNQMETVGPDDLVQSISTFGILGELHSLYGSMYTILGVEIPIQPKRTRVTNAASITNDSAAPEDQPGDDFDAESEIIE